MVSLAVPSFPGAPLGNTGTPPPPRGSLLTTLNTRQTLFLVFLFVVTSLAFIQLDSRRALDPVKDAMRGDRRSGRHPGRECGTARRRRAWKVRSPP